MSAVMKSDTFTGTAICKARTPQEGQREKWRERKTHKHNVNTAAQSRQFGRVMPLFIVAFRFILLLLYRGIV